MNDVSIRDALAKWRYAPTVTAEGDVLRLTFMRPSAFLGVPAPADAATVCREIGCEPLELIRALNLPADVAASVVGGLERDLKAERVRVVLAEREAAAVVHAFDPEPTADAEKASRCGESSMKTISRLMGRYGLSALEAAEIVQRPEKARLLGGLFADPPFRTPWPIDGKSVLDACQKAAAELAAMRDQPGALLGVPARAGRSADYIIIDDPVAPESADRAGDILDPAGMSLVGVPAHPGAIFGQAFKIRPGVYEMNFRQTFGEPYTAARQRLPGEDPAPDDLARHMTPQARLLAEQTGIAFGLATAPGEPACYVGGCCLCRYATRIPEGGYSTAADATDRLIAGLDQASHLLGCKHWPRFKARILLEGLTALAGAAAAFRDALTAAADQAEKVADGMAALKGAMTASVDSSPSARKISRRIVGGIVASLVDHASEQAARAPGVAPSQPFLAAAAAKIRDALRERDEQAARKEGE